MDPQARDDHKRQFDRVTNIGAGCIAFLFDGARFTFTKRGGIAGAGRSFIPSVALINSPLLNSSNARRTRSKNASDACTRASFIP